MLKLRVCARSKIEYLNAKASASNVEKPVTQSTITPPSDVTSNLNLTEPVSEGAIERGIIGIK